MPLQKLQFRPGINREGTTLANEGGWFAGDKIRFRSGQVEKIGGWTLDTGMVVNNGYMYGVARSMFNWATLAGSNLLGIGTNQKFYIQAGISGPINDVTPIRFVTSAGAVTFTATNGSSVITVTDVGHGAQTGDFVTFSGAVGLGGNVTAAVLNFANGYEITYVSSSVYTITVGVVANASDTGYGGSSTVGTYQITTGNAIYTQNLGWGAGGWGGVTTGYSSTGWGIAAPASQGIGSQLRLWSQYNYGQNLVFNPRGGPIYYWVVDTANPTIYHPAQVISKTNTNTQDGVEWWYNSDGAAPTVCNYVTVSDSSDFVIAFGCDDYAVGGGTTGILNPMLVRWSDQQNILSWQPLVTNQAGSYTLGHGSQIVTAVQAQQQIVVFTDTAVYSMQYLGTPYVWGFNLMSNTSSILGPNCAVMANNVVYWMGNGKFYMYSGVVQTLPSTLREYVFQNINMSQAYQFFAAVNEEFNEIWWFYCSASSNTIDSYVIYNYLENVWYYGTMTRTAWVGNTLRSYPIAAGYANNSNNSAPFASIIYHEDGIDDGTTNPPTAINAFAQSSDFDIGDGHNFGFVWRIIPDVTFNGSTSASPNLNFTVLPRANPGAAYGPDDVPSVYSSQNYQNQRTYNVQQFTEYAYVRMRGRQMSLMVSSDQVGTQWALGVPRIDIKPDGRRP